MSTRRQLRRRPVPPRIKGRRTLNGDRRVDGHPHRGVDGARHGRERRILHAEVAAPGARQVPNGYIADIAVGRNIDARSREPLLTDFADTGEPHLPTVAHSLELSAGDRGNDAYLVSRLERRLEPIEKTNVLFADVNVDEAAHALFVQ